MILTDPIPPITSHSSSPQLYESARTRNSEQTQKDFDEIYAFLTGGAQYDPRVPGSPETCQNLCDPAESGLPSLNPLLTEMVQDQSLSPQTTSNAESPSQPLSASVSLPLTVPFPNEESQHTSPIDMPTEHAIPLDEIQMTMRDCFSDDTLIRPTNVARLNLAGRESIETASEDPLSVVETHLLQPFESGSTDPTTLQLMTTSVFSESSSMNAMTTHPAVATTSDVAQQVLGQSLPHIIAGNGNDETLTIRLDPPELGEVLVRIQKSDGGIAIRVAALEPSTQLFLEQHADDLSEFMSTNNDGLTMELETNHHFQDTRRQPWENQGRQHFPSAQQHSNIQEGTELGSPPPFKSTAEDFFA